MQKRNFGKKRIVWGILLSVEIFLILFCIWGMCGEKESYSFKDHKMELQGCLKNADGTYEINADTVEEETALISMKLPGLKKGVYEVWLAYDTGDLGNAARVRSEKAGYHKLYHNYIVIQPSAIQDRVSYRFFLWESVDDLNVEIVHSGPGRFALTDFTVVHTRQEYSMALFLILLFSLLADAIVYFFWTDRKKRIGKAERQVLFGIFVIFLLSCGELLVDYTLTGDDAPFHLNRIEGIAREWMAGHFPARMASYCLYGMGYPMSIMYPDVFIWPAVLLRGLGFDLSFSMKGEIAFINLLTTIISYFSFKNIFKSRTVGLWGSAVYTLSLYRLYNIYGRMALGEFIAMMFLPLLCWGLTRTFGEDEEAVKDEKTVFLLAGGYTGIVYSHVLTLELTVFFTVILCFLLRKRFFRKCTLLAFTKAAVLTAGLSLWYLIPFLDYSMKGNLDVFTRKIDIQVLGLYPSQLVGLFPWSGKFAFTYITGLKDARAYGMGAGLAAVFFYYLYIKADKVRTMNLKGSAEYLKIKTAAGIGVLAMLFSMSIFPWDAIGGLSESLHKVLSSIQFPYRFLEIVTIAASFLGCGIFAFLKQGKGGRKGNCFAVLILALTIFSSCFYMDYEAQTRARSDLREIAAIGSNRISGAEYLPKGTGIDELPYTNPVPGDGVVLEKYEKENTHAEFWCENKNTSKSYVECTYIYYPGYRAVDSATGRALSVTAGNNNVLRVEIPSGYTGKVNVDFTGGICWKMGEAVSAVFWIGVVTFGFMSCYKKRHILSPGKAVKG